MFTKEKIEAIDHKNEPVPHTPEKLKAQNEAQAAREAQGLASGPAANSQRPEPIKPKA